MRLPSPTAAEVGVAAALSSQVVVYLIIESTCVTSRRAFIWTESRSEEHTSELQSQSNLVCRLLLEKKKKKIRPMVFEGQNLTDHSCIFVAHGVRSWISHYLYVVLLHRKWLNTLTHKRTRSAIWSYI